MQPGTQLAHYEILSAIGRGGMGEVWKALDKKLGREVAIKTLPEEFARDADRLARFEREAKLLAALNHPNIAAIYGLEEDKGTHFLVLELVGGDTLADRIGRGAISVEDALPIALQITEALESAHDKGVIHRDLKPANIMVTPDGQVKVLDFGLAKALSADQSEANLSNSPTISMAATQQGVILGTAAYMSPEQARGETADNRADIWSFGVVLYEMLTGRQLFDGGTLSDTLASVLKDTPDWNALPSNVPSSVRRLLGRAIEKDRRLRLRHIGDARIEIVEGTTEPDAPLDRIETVGQRNAWMPISFAVAVTALVSAIAAWILIPASEAPTPPRALNLALPTGQMLVDPHSERPSRYPPIDLSDDGAWLAYQASVDGGPPRLFVRDLSGFDARELEGTENAELPFFSPDGDWLGFWVNDTIYRSPVSGGTPLVVGTVRGAARGGAWETDSTMVLGGNNRGLVRLDIDTGNLTEITEVNPDREEEFHAWPSILPDGEHLLFSVVTSASSDIALMDFASGRWEFVAGTEDATQPHYLDSGHLVFFRGGSLFAAPFSPSQPTLTGPSIPVRDNVLEKTNAGHKIGYFSVSGNGTLVYVPAGEWSPENNIVSVDREGNATEVGSDPGVYGYGIGLSPSGSHVVVTNNITGNGAIEVHDLTRGTVTVLSRGSSIYPVWMPEGDQILYAPFRGPSFDIWITAADGTGEPERLLDRPDGQLPSSVTRDGRFAALTEGDPVTGSDIHILSLEDRTLEPFRATDWREQDPAFSPDGRYLAYISNQSGRDEVYVEAISGSDMRVTISSNGGRWPRWSSDGDELFYIAPNGPTMMSVAVESEPSLGAATPVPLFTGPYNLWYDVAADGSFVMITKPTANLDEINVILNWSETLNELVPVQ